MGRNETCRAIKPKLLRYTSQQRKIQRRGNVQLPVYPFFVWNNFCVILFSTNIPKSYYLWSIYGYICYIYAHRAQKKKRKTENDKCFSHSAYYLHHIPHLLLITMYTQYVSIMHIYKHIYTTLLCIYILQRKTTIWTTRGARDYMHSTPAHAHTKYKGCYFWDIFLFLFFFCFSIFFCLSIQETQRSSRMYYIYTYIPMCDFCLFVLLCSLWT